MTVADVEHLRSAWAAAHPRRAAGGMTSLTGFEYQVHATLRDAIARWLEDDSAIEPVTEVLSDLLSHDPTGTVTITQVKRTGSSRGLTSALDELWTIFEVAQATSSPLLPRIVFEVRCATWELADVPAAIARWQPNAPTDPTLLASFKALVQPTTDPDPFGEALVLLSNRLRHPNPMAWLERWTGVLIRGAAGGVDPSMLGLSLYAELGAVRDSANPLPAGISLIDPRTVEPTEVVRGEYLVGDQPLLKHVAEGRLAPRPWHLGLLTDEFLEWSAEYERDPSSERVPCFWITGRSGAGKSTLLLQFGVRLAGLGFGPVLWLGNRRHLIAAAVEYASNLGDDALPVICVDDPFPPSTATGEIEPAWRSTLDLISTMREGSRPLPLILACGPDEQAAAFERALREYITLKTFVIEPSRDDLNAAQLAAWFEQRSGRTAPTTTGSGDVLMVQRFFEWQVSGSLQSFASRFRERVERLDRSGELTALFGRLLAANRLYAGLPPSTFDQLSGPSRDAASRLEDDHHIAISNSPDGRIGLWLTHPHLADALFDGWIPEDRPFERADVLVDAALDCAAGGTTYSDQAAVLWAIASVLQEPMTSPIARRVDRPRLGHVLGRLWERWPQVDGEHPTHHLPAFVHLRIAAGSEDAGPTGDTILRAGLDRLRTASTDEDGLGLLCLVVLRSLEALPATLATEATATIAQRLDSEPEWSDWERIALALESATDDHADARRLLRRLTHTEVSADSVPRLLSRALTNPSTTADATDEIVDRSRSAPPSASWSTLFERAANARDDRLTASLLEWARRHSTEHSVLPPLTALVRTEVSPAIFDTALELIDNALPGPRAGVLTTALLESLDGVSQIPAWLSLERLDSVVSRSLERSGPTTSSSFVFEAVARSRWLDLLPQLSVATTTWMEVASSDPGWAHVYQAMIDRDDRSPEPSLVDLGLRWTERSGDEATFPFVLTKLLRVTTGRHRDRLVSTGIRWLGDHPHDYVWPIVLRKLLEASNGDTRARLIDLGASWIPEHPDHPQWDVHLGRLLDLTTDDARRQLIAIGTDWLPDHEHSARWPHLVELLLPVTNDDTRDRLVTAAIDWLPAHFDDPGWNYLVQALVKITAGRTPQRLVDITIDWLTDNGDHVGWVQFVEHLLDDTTGVDRDRLVATAIDWLPGHSDDPRWNHVVQILVARATGDARERVVTAAIAWLPDHTEEPGWNYVIQALLPATTGTTRDRLITIAVDWLTAHPSHPGWGHVVAKVLAVDPDACVRADLVERARAWLATDPKSSSTERVRHEIGDAP